MTTRGIYLRGKLLSFIAHRAPVLNTCVFLSLFFGYKLRLSSISWSMDGTRLGYLYNVQEFGNLLISHSEVIHVR